MNLKLFMIGIAALLLAACGGDGGASTTQSAGGGSAIPSSTTTIPSSTTTGTSNRVTNSSSAIGATLTGNSFELGVIGNMPYYDQNAAWTNARNELNTAALSFAVHLGNLKGFNRQCDTTYYTTLLNQFNALTHSLIYTPGENDWATCSRIDNGNYYFEDRLSLLRNLFFSGNQSLGQNKLTLKRQSTEMVGYGAYPENALWTINNVTFATFHVVGYNDNAGLQPGDNTAAGLQRSGESAARQAANLAWLSYVFTAAKSSKGLMLFMHQSNPAWDTPSSGTTPPTVYTPFFNNLVSLAGAYGKPVLVAQGGSLAGSNFRFDKPNLAPGQGADIRYLNRLQVFGNDDMHWVRVLVNPDSTDVFYIQPEIIDENRRTVSAATPVGVKGCAFCVDPAQSFDLGVIGDQPISILPDAEWNNLMTDMEQANLRFAMHTGNIRPNLTNTPCSDGHYAGVLAKFNAFAKPFFYTPGENDWVLCPSADPTERLARLRQFFTIQGDKSFGQQPMFVNSQSDFLSYRKYSENKMWSVNNVMFATLHTVGDTTSAPNNNNTNIPRNNNFNDITGTNADEFTERQAANLDWIHLAFQQAKNQNAAGVAFFTHGHSDWLDNDAYPSASISQAYGQILELLRSETIGFGKPVLLVHGGEYGYFRVDKPLTDDVEPFDGSNKLLENFMRVENFGGARHAKGDLLHNLAHWVRITVDPSHPDVFLVRAEIVENN